MAIRLTKKNSVIFAVVIVILCGSLGYLVWRVNQPETTAPTESEAGEGPACNYGSECTSVRCRWPWVAYCNTESPDSPTDGKRGFCECRKPESQTINPCRTKDPISDDNCHPPTCPSGEKVCCNWNEIDCDSKCGEGAHEIKTECRCSSCNNPYYLSVYCKAEPVASCGDGVVGNTPGEECDPPNDPCTKDGHSGKCSSTCKCVLDPYCGDGVVGTGEECDPPNSPCTKDEKSGTCSSTCQCAVNPYCGDGQLKDDEECEVGDPAGVKCAWTSCNQSACICLPPGLSISKAVVSQCIDEGSENPNSELLYTITVSNTGTGVGQVSKIEDTLDTKIITAGIVPTDITEGGSYLEGKITWLFSTPLTISPGETKVYSYKMMIDKSHFGIYANTVVLTPVSGDPIQATATINADCIITVPTVPQTGIFDSTVGRIAGGFGLIALGGFVYSMPSRVFLLNRQSDERKRNKYRVKFESKIFKK